MNIHTTNERAFINELNELEQLAYRTSIKIQTQINSEIRDARVSTFYFMAQVIRSLKIYLILKKEYLDHQEWYIETYLSKYKQQWPITAGKVSQIVNDHRVLTKEFNEVMLMGYPQILFSIVESKFRLFQMTIDPNALKGKSHEFYHVYTWLLTRVNKTRYKRLLRFFALIRNTIHNNGKYMNTNYMHVRIQYREKNTNLITISLSITEVAHLVCYYCKSRQMLSI